MATKHGDNFYVKTYGDSFRLNGELKSVKQKWMVYLRKYHIATFGSKKEAVEFAESRNNSPLKDSIVLNTIKQKESEYISECGKTSYSGVLAMLRTLKYNCDRLSSDVGKAMSALEKTMRRNGDE